MSQKRNQPFLTLDLNTKVVFFAKKHFKSLFTKVDANKRLNFNL